MKKTFGGTERYWLALLALANSTDDWKERLRAAAFQIIVLDAFDFPSELRPRHASLKELLTHLPGENEITSIDVVVYQMKEEEGKRAIEEVVAICHGLKSAE